MQIAVPSTYILSLWLAAHSYEYRTPGSARVQLMLGWFSLPFYKGGETCFFPPSSSSFLLFRQCSLPSLSDILSRVRINCYLIITRDYYFSFLFLFQRAKRNLPSFPGGRLTLERVGISKGSVERAHRSTFSWGCCRAITICHDTSTWPVLRVALRLLIGGKDF